MIADSSALIHLSRIGRLDFLKEFGEIKITEDVYRETVEEARGREGVSSIGEACSSWISVIKMENEKKIKKVAEQEGIENADASLILLAEEKKEILLSNDYYLIRAARGRGVECWWLTTLLLRAVKGKKIKKEEAKQMLFGLVESGMRLSIEVYTAVLKRIDEG
ncbi:MAG: hypothetical protein HY930_06740 [Euryarchaeota archaeon]|nr:hypothetical protein [Euryarchaeota archaeon]